MLTTSICLNTKPTGETAAPPLDPEWDYYSNSHKWERNCFLLCIKAGLKAGHPTAINHSKQFAVNQGPDESPITFLERLREALIKRTDLDSVLRGTGDTKGYIFNSASFWY